MICFNKCCLNIVLFSLIFCNCYIIVFSLVDFKPGGRGFKFGSVNFFFFFFFTFFFFFFFKYIESVFVQILPLPLPPPHIFFYFLNIVQYFFVPCTIPTTLGSHPPYPTSPTTPNIAFTSTLTHPAHQPDSPPDPPPPPQKKKFFFFLIFHKNFNSSFTSTLNSLTPRPPPPPPPQIFYLFFTFHKNFNSTFTSTLTPPPLPEPPPIFFLIFTKTSILRSHPP